ncbi:hypothetical protein KEM09_06370 [Carboxylicivirga mesophila]|uniref:Uncharacterized protein n=1 Tax=Carboxylicivirga mesophila TaxID=1166478 RepID=A0ABS5K7S5_9BACT|nr:hypothetical protein [Carboxylicivirga mesophila]MBS2211016.1 hypothetical protein [Carboxylicivirga mesophila]
MRLSIILISLFLGVLNVNSQCINFAKSVGKDYLGEYIHDGNYNATILEEGEKAELYKTFFSGQKYRVAIAKVEQLPDIHFRILDKEGNVLFDNIKYDYRLVWDFKVESTQMLIVELNVLEKSTGADDLINGCVSVLFGLEPGKKKKK